MAERMVLDTSKFTNDELIQIQRALDKFTSADGWAWLGCLSEKDMKTICNKSAMYGFKTGACSVLIGLAVGKVIGYVILRNQEKKRKKEYEEMKNKLDESMV